MSLQRSLQKGRHGDASDQFTGRLQVGQEAVMLLQGYRLQATGYRLQATGGPAQPTAETPSQVHVVSRNGTLSAVCAGRLAATFAPARKRIVQR